MRHTARSDVKNSGPCISWTAWSSLSQSHLRWRSSQFYGQGEGEGRLRSEARTEAPTSTLQRRSIIQFIDRPIHPNSRQTFRMFWGKILISIIKRPLGYHSITRQRHEDWPSNIHREIFAGGRGTVLYLHCTRYIHTLSLVPYYVSPN